MQRLQQPPIPKLRLRRRDIDGKYLNLGKYGTAGAQERYDRSIAEWLAK